MWKKKQLLYYRGWKILSPKLYNENHEQRKKINKRNSDGLGLNKELRHSGPQSMQEKKPYYLFIFPTILG